MTDRYKSLTVVLEKDLREDDAEPLINAILQIKGVFKVDGNVVHSDDYVARARVRRELQNKLLKVLK